MQVEHQLSMLNWGVLSYANWTLILTLTVVVWLYQSALYNKINHTRIIFRGAYHDNCDNSLILHFWRARLLADRFVNVV